MTIKQREKELLALEEKLSFQAGISTQSMQWLAQEANLTTQKINKIQSTGTKTEQLEQLYKKYHYLFAKQKLEVETFNKIKQQINQYIAKKIMFDALNFKDKNK